jgi:ribose/xylose/arabinose/galactoside ABC-type transport system permease subunit
MSKDLIETGTGNSLTKEERDKAKGKSIWRKLSAPLIWAWDNAGAVVALVPIMVVLSLTAPNFLTAGNLANVARQSAMLAILAIAQTLVLITAGIDLSVGATVAFSAVTLAVLYREGAPAVVAILAALAAGAAFGLVNGMVVVKAKIPPFITTLGSMSIARGVALMLARGMTVGNLPDSVIWLGNRDVIGIPASAWLALIIVILMWVMLRSTALGRGAYAIGGNQPAARLAGIPVDRYLVEIYALVGLLSGVTGVILAGRIYSASGLMGAGLELKSIAAAVIGGTSLFGGEGNVIGSLIGALILGFIWNGLNLLNVSAFLQEFFFGLLILVVVFLNQLRLRRRA